MIVLIKTVMCVHADTLTLKSLLRQKERLRVEKYCTFENCFESLIHNVEVLLLEDMWSSTVTDSWES